MEPKDLKNSGELERAKKSDLVNSEKNNVPSEKETIVETSFDEENVEIVNEPPSPVSDEISGDEEVSEELQETESITVSEEKLPDLEAEVVEAETEITISETESISELEKEAPEETVSEETVSEEKESIDIVATEEKEPADIKKSKEKLHEVEEEVVEAVEDSVVETETEITVPETELISEKVKETPEETETEEKESVEIVVAEVKKPAATQKKETIDYSTYSQVELVNALREILENVGENDIKDEVDIIRSLFYKNYKAEVEAQKKLFIEQERDIEEFVAAPDPYEQDMKELLKKYRNLRFDFNKKLETEKEENLRLKYQVIEEIKSLINKEESINKTFQEFRDLQRRWREIGLVPQAEMKNLWDTYHFHVENFYDYIKINQELRDLDLKKNLEIKIELCERTEELLVEPNIVRAFNTLQKHHEQWREIGPVPVEQKDDIWERFKAATLKINKKYQDYFENRKDEQKSNLDAKIALCEKVEEIIEMDIVTHKDWDNKSSELVELQKIWRTIGFAPRKDNNKVYDRFRKACDKFFDAKREFYSKNKELQQNNLQMKIDLCIEAEALKDNTDWKKTTQDFINIQKRWKEIGPVPRKHSDNLWKRFRSACDYFFEKKSTHFSGIDSEQGENLRLKNELIAEVVNFKPSNSVEENLKTLKSFQRRWTEIGHVPLKKKDEIQNTFREAINKLYDNLNLDDEKRNILKFKSKMTSFSETNRGQNKMRFEREKYMIKLKQLENDLVLLDNNIGFFAKSKNAESLIKDVKKKIENTREKIEFLKEKIRVIDEIDPNDY